MQIGTTELRQRMRKVLDLVEQGEHVRIVRRGRVIAELAPIASSSRGLPDLAAFRAEIKATGKPTSRLVLDERRKSRG